MDSGRLAAGLVTLIACASIARPASAQEPTALSIATMTRRSIERAAQARDGPGAPAQVELDWTRVIGLKPRTEIRITLASLERTTRRFVSADASSVTVGSGRAVERIARADIAEIATRDPKAGVALAVAGLSCFVIGAAIRNPEAGPTPLVFVGWPLVIAGAVAHHKAWKFVYRRP